MVKENWQKHWQQWQQKISFCLCNLMTRIVSCSQFWANFPNTIPRIYKSITGQSPRDICNKTTVFVINIFEAFAIKLCPCVKLFVEFDIFSLEFIGWLCILSILFLFVPGCLVEFGMVVNLDIYFVLMWKIYWLLLHIQNGSEFQWKYLNSVW